MLIATEAASPYSGPVVWVCLIVGGLFLLTGAIIALVKDLPAEKDARDAAKAAADAAKKVKPDAQGKVDAVAQGAVVDMAKAVGDLAGSLKDLSVARTLMVIGVFLVGVAAIASGADALGDGSTATTPSTSTTTTTITVP